MGSVRRPHELLLPLGCTAALGAMSMLPAVMSNAHLRGAFLGAAGVLGAWHGFLLFQTRRRSRILALQVMLRPQHYIQACAQGAVLLYWGWYWREVYDSAYLLAAQLLFAYAFDLLLTWTRRDSYALGVGPVPVVFSINLFLWFKPDWFYLQFLLIALGFAIKELCRWDKDGRRAHIFNPSSFPLALCSLGLIVTGATDLTWGQEIATTLNNAPQIYLVIFLASLPGQILFGVTTMTLSAVVTMYLFGLVYVASVGTYYFVDAYVPIAVFLGMHLLFTDPSTSPRTELGKVVFGVIYALSVIALYDVLAAVGAPGFYDKLLAVPVMNLLIRAIDRFACSIAPRRATFERAARGDTTPRSEMHQGLPGSTSTGRRRNLAHAGLWAMVFIGMTTAQAVGDTHRGQRVTFWRQACAENRQNGCRHFGVLVSTYCDNGSGWACNEYGVLLQPERRPDLAAAAFGRACDLGYTAGCANLDPTRASSPVTMAPTLADYGVVLRQPKGQRSALTPRQTYQLACAQGFADGCRHAGNETRGGGR